MNELNDAVEKAYLEGKKRWERERVELEQKKLDA